MALIVYGMQVGSFAKSATRLYAMRPGSRSSRNSPRNRTKRAWISSAFSAFEGTPLAMVLSDCGLSAFAIVGIATEIGIDPTVATAPISA